MDLYNVLGVDRNATQDELKKAYRNYLRISPDVNKDSNAEENLRRFQVLMMFYQTMIKE
jgi:DnaJ-class molecular chaperone